MTGIRISLLHATYRAGIEAIAVREEWMARAARPERVEYIFACDHDDEISMGCPAIAAGVVGAPMPGRVSAVRNWNAAASASTGDLLMVVADDLHPPQDWDAALESLCRDLDPRRAAFVIKVRDHKDDHVGLIRHPILSRRYFERFGLWHPQYEGYVVDNDFTLCAHRRNVVIDGRRLQLNHRSPLEGGATSASHQLMRESREVGKAVFARRWPVWKRRLVRLPLRPRSGQRTISPWSQLARASLSRTGYLLALIPRPILDRLRAIRRR